MTTATETLALLGLTQEQMQERVVEKIAREMLRTHGSDDDEYDDEGNPAFRIRLEKAIKEKIAEAIDATVRTIGDRHVTPHVTRKIEEMIFQETTRWGEKVGESMTFVQYLISRVEHYMTEEVDWHGKPRPPRGDYSSSSWKAYGTRIAAQMDRQLHHEIKVAMGAALKNANDTIAEGITKTVKLQLASILEGITCSVAVKS